MKTMFKVSFLVCVMVVMSSVAFGAEPQEIIDNTLEYIETQFSFGYEGHMVEEIEYTLIDVVEDGEDVYLFYEIIDIDDREYKTRVGFLVDQEENVIKGVLFDNKYIGCKAEI